MESNNTGVLMRNLMLAFGSLFLCLCLCAVAFGVGRLSAGTRTETAAEPTLVAQQATRTPRAVSPTPAAVQPTPQTPTDATPAGQDETVPPTRTPVPQADQATELTSEDLQVLFEVWDHIFRDFDGPKPSPDALLEAIINGSLDTLGDQHTRYIPPAAAARVREDMQGAFTGIGAFVRMDDEGFLRIVRPMAGQPAALAGLQPDDIILAANGTSLVGMDIDEAISYVRGPADTPVTLTIVREGVPDPFELTIVRQLIQIPTVEYQMLEGNIGYVHLWQFNTQAGPLMLDALNDLMEQQPRAIIFDLRDNPGGFLNQSVFVADIFLAEGVVLYERGSTGIDEVFRSQTNHPAENVPLVVLVNAGSASASELVAGAIQDRGRGIVIGETTFGKGSVQGTHTLSDGSELRVTIARWYTPNDRSIDGIGVSPDIEVVPSPLEFGGPSDTQLQRAIEYIETGQ
jgi:carboxyl-terminal processing protease